MKKYILSFLLIILSCICDSTFAVQKSIFNPQSGIRTGIESDDVTVSLTYECRNGRWAATIHLHYKWQEYARARYPMNYITELRASKIVFYDRKRAVFGYDFVIPETQVLTTPWCGCPPEGIGNAWWFLRRGYADTWQDKGLIQKIEQELTDTYLPPEAQNLPVILPTLRNIDFELQNPSVPASSDACVSDPIDYLNDTISWFCGQYIPPRSGAGYDIANEEDPLFDINWQIVGTPTCDGILTPPQWWNGRSIIQMLAYFETLGSISRNENSWSIIPESETWTGTGWSNVNNTEIQYICDGNTWTLNVKYSIAWGSDIRLNFIIANKGFIKSPPSSPWKIDNFYIPWCGCPKSISEDIEITSQDGNARLDFRPEWDGIPSRCTSWWWNSWGRWTSFKDEQARFQCFINSSRGGIPCKEGACTLEESTPQYQACGSCVPTRSWKYAFSHINECKKSENMWNKDTNNGWTNTCGNVNRTTLVCDDFMNCLSWKWLCTDNSTISGKPWTEPPWADTLSLYDSINGGKWVWWDWSCGSDTCFACRPWFVVSGSTCILGNESSSGSSSWHPNLAPEELALAKGNVRWVLQRITCDTEWYVTVQGWACDISSPSRTISVHFYADTVQSGNLIWSVIADRDMDQTSIREVCGGTSNHRFNGKVLMKPVTNTQNPIDVKWRDGKEKRVTAIGIGGERKDDAYLSYLDKDSPYFTCPLPWNTTNTGDSSQDPAGMRPWESSACGSANGTIISETPSVWLCKDGAKMTEGVTYTPQCSGTIRPDWLCASWSWKCDTNTCKAWEARKQDTPWNVQISISGNILSGTIRGLEQNDSYFCLESVEKSSGENAFNSCSENADASRWTKLISGKDGWSFEGNVWTWQKEVWVSIFPEWSYKAYWKNFVWNKKIQTKFQVLISRWIRIIGNATSLDTYWKGNTPYIWSESKLSSMRQTLQKNIANKTRNIKEGELVDGIVWYEKQGMRISSIDKNTKTVVVYGDLIIDSDIPETLGIIVMKNKNGVWGDIIVENSVEKIQWYIFAEWNFRWLSDNHGEKNWDLQLVVQWALYSRNTIGGSAFPDDLFVYPRISTDDRDRAFIEDLNNVRSGNGGKKYRDIYIDAFIIDFDTSIITNPPPWF